MSGSRKAYGGNTFRVRGAVRHHSDSRDGRKNLHRPAEIYPTEDNFGNALQKFPTWRQIIDSLSESAEPKADKPIGDWERAEAVATAKASRRFVTNPGGQVPVTTS